MTTTRRAASTGPPAGNKKPCLSSGPPTNVPWTVSLRSSGIGKPLSQARHIQCSASHPCLVLVGMKTPTSGPHDVRAAEEAVTSDTSDNERSVLPRSFEQAALRHV